MTRPSRHLLLVPAVAAILGLGAIAAQAARPGQLPGCNNPRAVARYLQLTPAQIADVKELRADLKAAVDPLRDQIKDLHEQIETALDAASPDACAIGALRIQIHGLAEQVRDERDDFEAAFEALLTPAQLAKWEALQVVCRAQDETTGG
jgi:Spy/CpxP family protein refolding chaperone